MSREAHWVNKAKIYWQKVLHQHKCRALLCSDNRSPNACFFPLHLIHIIFFKAISFTIQMILYSEYSILAPPSLDVLYAFTTCDQGPFQLKVLSLQFD